jgi:hypothetical protein
LQVASRTCTTCTTALPTPPPSSAPFNILQVTICGPCDRLPAYLPPRSSNGTTTTPTTSAVLEAHIHPFNVTQLHISIPSQGQSPSMGHRCKPTHSHGPSPLPVHRFLSRLLPRGDGKRHLLAENVSVWITLGSSPNTAVNIDVIELFLAGQY